MKKIVLGLFVTVAMCFVFAGCNLGKYMPPVITDSVSGTSWTIQGTGSGTKTRSFTLTQSQLDKMTASVQFVGGSASLLMTQGDHSKTTVLSGSGITNGDVDIDATGFLPDIQITMTVTVTNILGGQTTISWR